MGHSGPALTDANWLLNLDVSLQTFYHDVIQKEMDVKAHASEIKKALREVVNSYKKDACLLWTGDKRECNETCSLRSKMVVKNKELLQIEHRNEISVEDNGTRHVVDCNLDDTISKSGCHISSNTNENVAEKEEWSIASRSSKSKLKIHRVKTDLQQNVAPEDISTHMNIKTLDTHNSETNLNNYLEIQNFYTVLTTNTDSLQNIDFKNDYDVNRSTQSVEKSSNNHLNRRNSLVCCTVTNLPQNETSKTNNYVNKSKISMEKSSHHHLKERDSLVCCTKTDLPQNIASHNNCHVNRFNSEMSSNNHLKGQNSLICCTRTNLPQNGAFGDNRKPHRSSTLRFDSSAKRCAYVLKHGPCFTSAVARHLLRLFILRRDVLQGVMERGEIAICCLGGGPASDAVAVVRVISIFYQPLWLRKNRPLHFRITVVDWNEDWAVTSRQVMQTLRKNSEWFHVDSIRLSFDFVKADLTQPLEPLVEQTIADADLCTMVYFLSAVNEGKDSAESYAMVQTIMTLMKKGAILFFLDSAADVHHKQMAYAASSLGSMERIYSSAREEFHKISLASVRKFLQIYWDKLGLYVGMTHCFICACAWVKTGDMFKRDCRWLRDHPKNSPQEQVDHLTNRMLLYRSKVQRIMAEFKSKCQSERKCISNLEKKWR